MGGEAAEQSPVNLRSGAWGLYRLWYLRWFFPSYVLSPGHGGICLHVFGIILESSHKSFSQHHFGLQYLQHRQFMSIIRCLNRKKKKHICFCSAFTDTGSTCPYHSTGTSGDSVTMYLYNTVIPLLVTASIWVSKASGLRLVRLALSELTTFCLQLWFTQFSCDSKFSNCSGVYG